MAQAPGSKEISERFVRYFCNADFPGLASVLSDKLIFNGPLLRCSSKSEYLESLSGNLEPDPEHSVRASFSEGDKAAVFYRYKGISIAQLFLCKRGKIVETSVVFDSARIA